MMILDKRKNLTTLFNLGATIKEIRRIFILQGLLLTFVGLFIGMVLAITLVILQKQFGFIMITSSLAYPVEFKLVNVLVVLATIAVLGYLAAQIASARISKSLIR